MNWNNLWQFLAGLGVFLFGMFQLEESLKKLAGRNFKVFLKKHTESKFGAIFSGTIITSLLQSSSVVNLIVLSFVGSGVLSMRNALGVVFGANLGSTVTSWIIVTLGFKFDIEKFSFPIIAIAGIGIMAFRNKKKLYQLAKFLMGFGMLFLGLGIMKESFFMLVQNFDLSLYRELNLFIFVLLGFAITAIIQSSSITMVIVLSALNTNTINFPIAVAIIIGSELGTSIKILLGSIGGIAAKKRVALGNFIFNTTTVIFSFAFIYPIINFIVLILGPTEPLVGLVLFQSLINLIGVILFFPLLNHLSSLLEKCFTKNNSMATSFIANINLNMPELAVNLIQKETLLFICRVIHLNREAFKIVSQPNDISVLNEEIITKNEIHLRSYSEKYQRVKQAEGEVLSCYTQIIEEKIEKEDFIRINQLMASVRNAMYAAKGIKDIRDDKNDLRESALDIKYMHYELTQSQLRIFYERIDILLTQKDESKCFQQLVYLMKYIVDAYQERMADIYKESKSRNIEMSDISTLLNMNREVYSSCKALIFSLRDFVLSAAQVEEFDNVSPSQIH